MVKTDFAPHCLRDTFAVDLLKKGVPLEEVSKLLGHKSIKTTEESYAKWVQARQDRLRTGCRDVDEMTEDLQAIHQRVSLLS
jgi:site-specific recombinase XerD